MINKSTPLIILFVVVIAVAGSIEGLRQMSIEVWIAILIVANAFCACILLGWLISKIIKRRTK